MKLTGKNAIVVGGRRSIGRAYCERLAIDGTNIALSQQSQDLAYITSKCSIHTLTRALATVSEDASFISGQICM